MIPDGFILFGRVYKIVTMRRTTQSYSRDSSSMVKLITKKEERAREMFLALVLRERM